MSEFATIFGRDLTSRRSFARSDSAISTTSTSSSLTNTTTMIPTIELSNNQAIHLVDGSCSCSSSFDDFVVTTEDHHDPPSHFYKNNEHDSNILQVPMAAVELVETNNDNSTDSPLLWAAPAPEQELQRAFLLSATVFKETADDKLGLGLARTSMGHTIISSIKPEGLMSHSPFQVGDRLISINNISCQTMRKSEAGKLLRRLVGNCTIVVQNDSGDTTLVESMIWKPRPDSKTGLAVVSNGYSKPRVSNIRPNGLFCDSLLSRKDLILSVNDIPCHFLDSKEVADLVMRANDYVTVVAERKFESAVVVAAQ